MLCAFSLNWLTMALSTAVGEVFGVDFVGGREQVSLGLAMGIGRQAETGRMCEGLLVPLEVPGFLTQQRDDLRDPDPLRDGDLGLLREDGLSSRARASEAFMCRCTW